MSLLDVESSPASCHKARRPKSILEIPGRKQIFRATKYGHRHALRDGAFVTAEQVRFPVARKSQFRNPKREIVFEDGGKVSTGSIKIEVDLNRAIALI